MRTFIVAISSACVATVPASARGAMLSLDLPSQPLARSLSQLAGQADVELLFSPSLVGRRRAPAVRGRFSLDDALGRLLAGSGLVYRRGAGGTVLIVASPPVRKAPATEDGPLPEILVIGRRSQNADIRRTERDIQPYQVATRNDVEDSHVDSPEAYLRTRLPANAQMSGPAQLTFDNLGSTRSEINLRGLGPRQTLVLLDGRRLPSLPSTETGFYQPDVNALPLAAVARIETITSTAGGIYGPGAAAGVVNFILDRDYRGGSVALTSGATSRADTGMQRIDASLGFTPDGGRTDIMLAFGRSETESLAFGDRSYAVRARRLKARNDLAQFLSQWPTSGSINVIGSRPLGLTSANGSIPLGATITHAPIGQAQDRSLLLANAGTLDLSLSPDANGATRTLLPAAMRTAFLLNLRHRVTDGAELFLDGLWMRNRGQSIIPWFIQVATVGNPAFGPFDQPVTVTFPMSGFDNRLTNRASMSRVSAGLILELPRAWRTNIDYTIGSARQRARLSGDSPSYTALTGLFGAPDGAVPNPFSDFSDFLSALEAYRRPNRFEFTLENQLRQISARVAGPLLQLGGGPLTLSLLAEDRREHVPGSLITETLADRVTERPLPEVRQQARSLYIEMRAPLLGQSTRWTWLRGLEAQLAIRNDWYRNTAPSQDEGGGALFETLATSHTMTTVYTAGLRFQPVPAVMLRASLSTGIVPPGIDQISSRVIPNFETGADPRRGNSRIGYDVPVLVGGSPELHPERASSLTAGAVLSAFDSRLRLSVDYTSIHKGEEIVLTSANGLRYLTDFGAVAFFVANEARFPDRITRAPLSAADAARGYSVGPITRIDTTAMNSGSTRLTAVDFKADFVLPVRNAGQLRFTGAATWQPTFRRRFDPEGPWYNLANYFDGALTWRGHAGVQWSRGPFRVGLEGQYYGRYRVVSHGRFAELRADDANRLQGSRFVEAQVYFDLAATYRVPVGQGGRELRFGIENLFDRSPPIVATNDSYFQYTQTGYSLLADPRRRRFDVSIVQRF